MLLGNYSEDRTTAIIKSISISENISNIPHVFFDRDADNKLLDKKYRIGQFYLGDWHTHPNSTPEPSSTDDKQMREFAVDDNLNCPEPILLIIGQNHKLTVNVYTKEDKVEFNLNNY